MSAELLRRHGFGFGALVGENRDEFGRGQHLADLGIERINDIRRYSGRPDNAPPVTDRSTPGDSGLFQGRHVG